MKFNFTTKLTLLLGLCFVPFGLAHGQDNEGFAAERDAASAFALAHLSDRDPTVRQRAAEVLAKFSDADHLRLTEGYRLQENNERVRLALDWALYRMGKRDTLYGIVRELRSDSRRPQAVGYLSQLVGPESLYGFFEGADSKTVIGLLQVMASIGDAETLEFIRPFEASFEPNVSHAARLTTSEITKRLAQPRPDVLTRPREVSADKSSTP